ncbi:uncharacterized protein C8R40DRAFT_1171844 [Lentinula edodes]|uniref:uncharacterized protein n=1 Tax=Lentinula edodes TaxID=5353 RepID=UPI001E8DBC14|nr:uncharacterized protein C8R40DRAFT_1171844 [Lentinula edodes]KAH7873925.1 hypothetical protein C8R40DRAFT_1171844 [Lentinula edodes]
MASGYSCNACKHTWRRDSDLTQHYLKTPNPRCRKEADALIAKLCINRSSPRRSLLRRRLPRHLSPMPATVDDDSARLIEQPVYKPDQVPPMRFVGDFFGQDYTTEDFPGLEDVEDNSDDDEGNDDDESNDDEGEVVTTELQWEPERQVQTCQSHDDMVIDPPITNAPHTSNPLLRSLPSHRDGIHIQRFGGQAGAPLPTSQPHYLSSQKSDPGFQQYQSSIVDSESNIWAPFTSKSDWEMACWAKIRGSGSTAFSELLLIDGVIEALGLSYRNSDDLNNIIDNELPSNRPSFTREEVVIAGQAFDFYKRDILECIRALYGNPDHCQYLCFTPERHYVDSNNTMRLYHDFNTGKWWWNTQKAVEADKPDATIFPVIISSDKTQITLFRNKAAYPQGQILLAYLPTSCLEHIRNKAAYRRTIANLFHACLKDLTAPLCKAGLEGTVMTSGDGLQRRCHPILAAFVGDYLEQILATTAYSGDCASCDAEKKDLGIYPCIHPYRDIEAVLEAIHTSTPDLWVEKCLECNVKPIQHPFWEDLPYTNIFTSITPDILHQLYQGVMKHLISWVTDICGADEIDARVRRLPPNHTIRTFHKGISTLSRVSGTEHKQMCSFILGVVTDIPHLSIHQSGTLLAATQALLDFLYLSCYPIHTTESLSQIDEALAQFHAHRGVFVELGVRKHFNIPKLHFLCHYSRSITYYETTDNYNTDTTERLHIDYAKDAYRASNRKDEYIQMTHWLERREKIMHHTNYISWRLSQVLNSPSSERSSHPTPITLSSDFGKRYDFPGAQRTLLDIKCIYTQKLTRFSSMRRVPLSRLEDTCSNGYCAVQFTHVLKRFLVQYRYPNIPINQIDEWARFVVLPFSLLPVWHKLKFVNTELFSKKTLDSFSAHPSSSKRSNKSIKPSRFDTVLVRLKQGNDWTKDMRVGRVRVIFSLPSDKLDTLVPSDIPPPQHLAYIEWFTKFVAHPEPYSGLYRVRRDVGADGLCTASIIALDSIVCSAHLFPQWGGSVPPDWTSQTILDHASSFLLNIFKDEHAYFNLS